jgi:Tol biopolymer transport system component
VADQVGRAELTLNSIYSASPNGALVYRSEISAAADLQPAWYNREGKRLASVGEPRVYRQGALSPDEKRFAAQIVDPKVGTSDIWLLDLSSGILSRMTSDPANKDTVEWSPDGREILFSSNQTGVLNLYRKVVGGGDAQLIQASTEAVFPAEWLKDGSMTFMDLNGKSFYRLAPGGGSKPETLLKTEYMKDEPRVSPDGRWVAYNTNESGRWEVYIAAFPSFTERRQVSNNGGVQGYWRKDGKELFYLSLDGNLVSVPIKPGPTLENGIPKVLFPTRIPVQFNFDQFAVTGDGQRFLLLEAIESEAKPFTVVLNWPAAVKR